ncbi:ATP-grasp domain-containing protein [Streptomyces iconiensis]|uniref:ATP-grasp domain-containing protein n=1 Tax=Streptomyces iconiensis TaxID=1384038 RepID=A0ABT6ZUJ9_9ACTN|nr:ATP-grasp domain-containing protein [Streptomyces iconiensis]MDJ1132742.1 ATP-grasp domain-containing protein [Streptomyces iconiensis]
MSILVLHKKNLSRRSHLDRARQYAREHGERLLLVMKDPEWEAEYVDRVVIADTSSIDETLAAVRALAADESEAFSAVVTFAEAPVPSAARVAAEFGLPSVSEHTARLARDKWTMREAFAAGGVPQPRYGIAHSLEEARGIAERTGYPLVMKPVLGTGSMFVRSVDNEEELAEHFDFFLKGSWERFTYDPLHDAAHKAYDGGLLLEEFLPGTEICVESLVHDGETRTLAIHDKPLPTGPTFEEVYACTPTRLPEKTVRMVEEATVKVHRALGIATGATHVEFRLRGDDEPAVLEAAARMGGGPIYRSVLLSTGVDMVEAVLDLASGRAPRVEPAERATPVGFWNIFPDKAGTLTRVTGLDTVRADPRVDEVQIYKAPGDELLVPPQTFQGHGHLIFTVNTEDELDPAFREMTSTLRLETE